MGKGEPLLTSIAVAVPRYSAYEISFPWPTRLFMVKGNVIKLQLTRVVYSLQLVQYESAVLAQGEPLVSTGEVDDMVVTHNELGAGRNGFPLPSSNPKPLGLLG